MASRHSVDRIFSDAVASKTMPGIVAVAATDGGVFYEGAFGKRGLGKDASMTKVITVTAAMQLVERGKLGLERPASDVVRELSDAKVNARARWVFAADVPESGRSRAVSSSRTERRQRSGVHLGAGRRRAALPDARSQPTCEV